MAAQEKTDARAVWLLRSKYLLYFVGWVASSALAVLILLRLRLTVLSASFPYVNPWARAAVDKFGLVVLGLICLGLIIIVEDYLRTSVPRNLLARRLAIVFGIEIAILLATYALQALFIW